MPTGSPRRNYRNRRSLIARIARERIDILLRQARDGAENDSRLAKRYVELARKISMRTKVRIPSSEKHYICKNCGQPIVPGRNARIRIAPGNPRVVITCLSCGTSRKYPFTKKRVDLCRSR